jgi:exodeoxyribonuclease V beta subunit
LHKDVNLIEASAGTGKTYAIAMLALRFIVEENIKINELLVVTFTKAATEELKDRIRARLAEAKRALIANNKDVGKEISAWLNSLSSLTAEEKKQRLDDALLNIDQASIFTIHGFCQLVLQERPLESGQLFTSELIDDIASVKQQCADDFWRRYIYPRSIWEASVLTASYKTPDALLTSIAYLPPHITIYPVHQDLDTALAALKQQADTAKNTLQNTIITLHRQFDEGKFKDKFIETFEHHANVLQAWLCNEDTQSPSKEAFALLTEQGLKEALNGNKFRTTKTQNGDDRKMEYLASLAIDTTPFDKLAATINNTTLSLRGTLLESLHTAIDKELQQRNELSFDSLITRLADALRNDGSDLLIKQLREDFKVALIDEFQDTDDSQWSIFRNLFAAPTQYLYLIGDPKQAIYKFRGADIYSYLDAKNCAEHQFTLGYNWRSHPQLVEAVNSLFRRPNPFFLEGLDFNAVKPGVSADKGNLVKDDQAIAPMMLWQIPQSEKSKGYWTAGEAGANIRNAIVSEIANLLTSDYRFQPENRSIQPKDIAILVRSNRQAREYQYALRVANIPSVLNSMESVFATQEATALYTLLRAISNPGNTALFKQAMTLTWFALDGQAFYQFINNEAAVDDGMGRFFSYYQQWQKSGLMAMMLEVLAQENIKANLSKTKLSERQITNIQHLLELLQQAAVEQRLNITKTVDYLQTAIAQASGSEDQQLRLESDENAVKIVTTHRSKGLEYYIVFCPYLWQRNSGETSLVICHENGKMVADIGSENFSQRRQLALNEELAEDLRVLYVAVTRAKYRCYLVWADVRTEKLPNQSALAWLLEFADADFAMQQTKLQSFQTEFPLAFDYQLLDDPELLNSSYQKSFERLELQAKTRSRFLYTPWQMSSYTALSALTIQDVAELPEDKADEQQARPDAGQSLLPKGAQTGNVVHELLERHSFRQLAGHHDISVQRDKVCLRYGLRLEQPERLDELLHTIVSTPLSETDAAFCLMNVSDDRCLKELPFYLSLNTLDTRAMNSVLQDDPAFQALTSKQIAGYLTGFIDLVCEYQGRYYIMDYKTNTLSDYNDETILQAMREHNYGLQYWLYTLVLHRYLQIRLPDYSYQQHFGGVRYLFVRGMQVDVVMRGVYQYTPEIEKVNALVALFDG